VRGKAEIDMGALLGRTWPLRIGTLAVLVTAGVLTNGLAAAGSFTTFESGQVRPLALSPDGNRLFAVNTPDAQLEIFDVTATGLVHESSVPVGLEPVAVAARTNDEVWVVNLLSDSISIVDVSADPARVTRTLLVGDEPRDIVFAGAGGNRAFITTAHRGQQRTDQSIASVPGAGDPQFTTPGVGRADVWVFDGTALGTTLGGTPVGIVTLFGDTPRALAVTPDGGTVYAAVFHSGNQTTTLSEGVVCNGFGSAAPCTVDGVLMPGGLPPPSTDATGEPAPETGLIVKFDPASGHWLDPLGRDWSAAVRFDLPDEDVFTLDAATLAQTGVFTHVGTTLFNMTINPMTGTVYVSNTDSHNEVRFEGPGVFGGSTVQGHLAEARITVLTPSGVFPRHLNKHIDYSQLPAPDGTKDHSLATPVGMATSADGSTLYVAAFGSSRIGVFDTVTLEGDTFDPTQTSANYIAVSGGGPSGLVLDAARQRLYVLTRFDDAVSVVDLAMHAEIGHLPLHNPEPASVVTGRPFLYDAVNTSSNGEASCASCHTFGDMDQLAWDLGNPDNAVTAIPIPINLAIAVTSGIGAFKLPAPINGTGSVSVFHPMKGPMTTQTLRGLKGSGAMHWRGDRSNPPGTLAKAFDEVNSFNNFNVAFPALLGRDSELSTTDMQSFTDFALQITLPPNPNRALDNSLNAAQQAGHDFFVGPRLADGIAGSILGQPLGFACEGCHRLQPTLGHFGTDGRASFENEEQVIKIPHLRNLYQKVGMFGGLDVAGEDPLNLPFQGPQIRGFGFLHDGSVDTLFRFLNAIVFSNNFVGGPNVGFPDDATRRNVEQYLLAFDSNLAPVVGQQMTLTASNAGVVGARLDLLIARAAAGECDLIVKGTDAGLQRGWLRGSDGLFADDRVTDPAITDSALRALAATVGQELTYTCVPPGSGVRAGIDRDEDGFLDRDELDAGSDPADPTSTPFTHTVLIRTSKLLLRDDTRPPLDPSKRRVTFVADTRHDPTSEQIVVPSAGGTGDPSQNGATLIVYDAAGLTSNMVDLKLPASGWTPLGRPDAPKGWQYRGAAGTAIQSVVIKKDHIVLRGGGSVWTYSLSQPAQGRIGFYLRLGSDTGWCTATGATSKGTPPSTATSDLPGLFDARHGSAAPASCPSLPASAL
jgi:DNA-binding beta-propeller fold protein YncE